MSSGACREYYPEEKLIIDFLKPILGEDFLRFGVSEENDEHLNRMQLLFTEMEKEGARNEIREKNERLCRMRNCLRSVCAHMPVEELLTHEGEDVREIGLEFQEIIDHLRKESPELVEGTTTAKEVYDRCEEWKRAQKTNG